MSINFYLGYTFTDNDLVAYFRDESGTLFDPYYVSYTIKYIDNNHNDIVGQEDRPPLRISTGRYRPNFTIPNRWSEGEYYIEWSYRSNDSSYDKIRYSTENFYIYSLYSYTGPHYYTGISYTSNDNYTMTGMNYTGILYITYI